MKLTNDFFLFVGLSIVLQVTKRGSPNWLHKVWGGSTKEKVIGSATDVLPMLAGWKLLPITNFARHISSCFSLFAPKKYLCFSKHAVSGAVRIKPKTILIYPHYCHGSMIALPLTIPSPSVTFVVRGFIFSSLCLQYWIWNW